MAFISSMTTKEAQEEYFEYLTRKLRTTTNMVSFINKHMMAMELDREEKRIIIGTLIMMDAFHYKQRLGDWQLSPNLIKPYSPFK